MCEKYFIGKDIIHSFCRMWVESMTAMWKSEGFYEYDFEIQEVSIWTGYINGSLADVFYCIQKVCIVSSN